MANREAHQVIWKRGQIRHFNTSFKKQKVQENGN